jgi:hypothetical protein
MNMPLQPGDRGAAEPAGTRLRSGTVSTALLWLLPAATLPAACWACATCGCTVNADAVMGFPAANGWRLDLEYDFIDQDQLRSGSGVATAAQVVNNPSDRALGGGEIESDTVNRYFRLGLSYQLDSNWNLGVSVPYILRDHSTYGVQQAPYSSAETAPDELSSAHVSNLGDVKVLASFQGLLSTHELGLQLGLKLPTGQDGTRTDFASGPERGTPLDASLQAGTGSTDLIIGAYFQHAVSQDFDAFATAQFQAAILDNLTRAGWDYRPGNSATFSLGLRYEANPRWLPQLQLMLFRKDADQGALADTTDSAGSVLYLNPGLTLQLLSKLHGYAVVQLPLYSDLAGYQLFPHWTATVGLSYRR